MYKVCIADDQEYVWKSIEARLKASRQDVEVAGTARNGIEAYELYEKERPDIFYVDIDMPVCSGLDFVERVRRLDRSSITQFIIVSGHDDFAYMKRAIRTSVVNYLMKPIQQQEFLDTLQEACERLQEQKQKRAAEIKEKIAEKERKNDLTDQVVDYLKLHYTEDISLADLAAEFFVTPNYLTKRFKEKQRVTTLQFLENYRMLKAMELLRDTDYPVTEIAGRVGYNDANYFTRAFRKLYGITPREYRNKKE